MGIVYDVLDAYIESELSKARQSVIKTSPPLADKKKKVSYREIEVIVNSYLSPLLNDIEELARTGSIQLQQRSLIKCSIKNRLAEFRHKLLQFFMDRE